MKTAKRYITYLLALIIIMIFIILGLFRRDVFDQLIDIVKIIWPAIIALLTFAGFVAGGLLKKKPKSFDEAFDDIYLQLTVTVSFLFVLGLLTFNFISDRSKVYEVFINTVPEGAEIWINNEFHSVTPDTIILPKKVSTILKLKKTGYSDETIHVDDIRDLEEDISTVVLQRIWEVTILSNNDSLYISVNGKILEKDQRRHQLNLTSDDYTVIYGLNQEAFDTSIMTIRSDTTLFLGVF